jgi:hypothetical protein
MDYCMIARFVTTKEYLVRKIAVVVVLVISLSSMNANAKGCSGNHVFVRCAVAHHPGKHASKKRPSMGGAFVGAYQR